MEVDFYSLFPITYIYVNIVRAVWHGVFHLKCVKNKETVNKMISYQCHFLAIMLQNVKTLKSMM